MSYTYFMCRSHLSDRIWHSVLSLTSRSHSVSFLVIAALFVRLILIFISRSYSQSPRRLWWTKKKQITYNYYWAYTAVSFTHPYRNRTLAGSSQTLFSTVYRQSGHVQPGLSSDASFSLCLYRTHGNARWPAHSRIIARRWSSQYVLRSTSFSEYC